MANKHENEIDDNYFNINFKTFTVYNVAKEKIDNLYPQAKSQHDKILGLAKTIENKSKHDQK